MEKVQIKACAKINLGLDVVRRLENGYHEVRMVMQTVDICDELTFVRAQSGIEVSADAPQLSVGEDNLICRAARLMQEEFGIREGVRVRLKKRIPIAAGMAGGSADAAATLRGMNRLFELGASDERLRGIGLRIGADVPYCVMGGTALAEGIGEKLTRLPSPPNCRLVVAKPEIDVSTKYVYEHLDGLASYPHPDIDGMVQALKEGNLEGVTGRLGNSLESVTEAAYPVVADIKGILSDCGALSSLMSGSGPAVFGIFEESKTAQAAARALEQSGIPGLAVFCTRFADAGDLVVLQE